MHFPEAAQKEWKAACYEEMESLDKCDVFELTDLPNGHKVIKQLAADGSLTSKVMVVRRLD